MRANSKYRIIDRTSNGIEKQTFTTTINCYKFVRLQTQIPPIVTFINKHFQIKRIKEPLVNRNRHNMKYTT